MKKTIVTLDAPAAIGAYAQGMKAQGFLFCSGQIGLRPDGTLVAGSIADEALQVMQNLEAILKAGSATFADVVQTTIYLTDISSFSIINEIYTRFFRECATYPARSTVAVAALPKGARVEISMIAQCKE